MGWGHEYRCPKCGKNGEIYCDSGMEYEQECKETYQAAQCGRMGSDWEICVKQNPLGAFDCKMEVYKCACCGFWKNDSRKNYYIRKNSKRALKYVSETNMEELECIKKFFHICPKCGGTMLYIDLKEEGLNCTECGTVLELLLHQFIWD